MIVLIMAGGLGSRMKSKIPKTLQLINHMPIIIHIITQLLTIKELNKIFVIVSPTNKILINSIIKYYYPKLDVEFIVQTESNGTGHAILCSLQFIEKYKNEYCLILPGDVPLISRNTLNNITRIKNNSMLITKYSNPYGYGRIIFNNNFISEIIEEKDCNEQQKLIKYVNGGIYYIQVNDLIEYIPRINNINKANEYYLTDVIKIMNEYNKQINYYELEQCNQYELLNVNTPVDLSRANEIYNDIYKMNALLL